MKNRIISLIIALFIIASVPFSCFAQYGEQQACDHEWTTVVIKEATCTEPGLSYKSCSNCKTIEGDSITVTPALGHDFSEVDKVNSTCNSIGYDTKMCSRCDATETFYSSTLAEHSFGEWSVVKEPDENESGLKMRTCSICNLSETESIKPIGEHCFEEDMIPATCTSDGTVTVKCTATHNCGQTTVKVIPSLNHDWTSWTVSENPTCTEFGEEKRTCRRDGCGAEESREVSPLGHDREIIGTVEKGENNEKYTDYKCSRCGWIYSIIEHSYVWETVKEATCSEEGTRKQACSACGAEGETEVVPKTAHSYVWETVKEATCFEEGSRKEVCTVCNAQGKTEMLPKTDHSYEWKTTKKATCTKDGSNEQVCSVCNAVGKTAKIAKTGHSYKWKTTKKATCTKDGSKKQICSVCNAVGKTKTIKAAHKWSKSGPNCEVCKTEDKFVKIVSVKCTRTEYTVGDKWNAKIIMTVKFKNHEADLVRTTAPKAFSTEKAAKISVIFNYGGKTSEPITFIVKNK